MRNLIIVFLLFASFFNCDAQKNILKLKHKPFYKESNILEIDSVTTLKHIVTFDKPHVIDESYSYILSFKIPNTSLAKVRKLINISQDTNIIEVNYDIASVWNWETEDVITSGTIEILNWETDRITLIENIIIQDIRTKEKVKFKGKRTFLRKETD